MMNFLNPYLLWIKIGLVALALAYVTYLNIRINYLKSDNIKLEAKNVVLVEANRNLQASVESQNHAIRVWLETAKNAQEAAQKALLLLKQHDAIRQPKINAATAHINLAKPDSCEASIETIKAELK